MVRFNIPEDPDIDVLWANVLQVTFAGEDFVLTVGQARPIPLATEADIRRVANRDLQVRVVGQFAVPTSKFIEAIENIYQLLGQLRKRGVLPTPDEGAEGTDAS